MPGVFRNRYSMEIEDSADRIHVVALCCGDGDKGMNLPVTFDHRLVRCQGSPHRVQRVMKPADFDGGEVHLRCDV